MCSNLNSCWIYNLIVCATQSADIRELKAAMLAHDSIEKSKRIYDKRNRLHDSDEVAEQYCEFMCLKIKSKDYSAETAKLSPGDKVDAFWHAHLLDTKGYIEFFSTVQADMVHHDAEKSDDPEEEILARQSKTKEVGNSFVKHRHICTRYL